MSADNGIYILTTAGPEYRVAYLMAIDNIYGNFSDESYQWQGDPDVMYSYFHDAKLFSDLEEALDYASALSYTHDYLEDGICVITDFKDWDFNSLGKNYGKEAKGNSR